MKKWLFALLCAVPAMPAFAGGVVGTWQLVEVVVPSLQDSNPRGIPAVKEMYTADGRLYFIGPTDRLDEKTASADYRIDGATRTVWFGSGPRMAATLSFPDDNTLLVTQSGGDQWRYQRMTDADAANRRIEPQSVEIVKLDPPVAIPPVQYDNSDTTAQPLAQRLQGTWEVIEHRDVRRDDAPSYGFFNDIWTIDGKRIATLLRSAPNGTPPALMPYQLFEGRLVVDTPQGQQISMYPT
ncbi:MAG: hypothetical protein ACREVL_17075, partial [Solimonas sp.]